MLQFFAHLTMKRVPILRKKHCAVWQRGTLCPCKNWQIT